MLRRFSRYAGLLLAALSFSIAEGSRSPATALEITMWTMGGDQPGWTKWLETGKAAFEAKNKGTTLKITYYDKSALLVALRTALRAGQGPDIYYFEPDQVEFADNGYLKPLETLDKWPDVEDWAKKAWTSIGHVWGIPLSAYTNEIYYNKDLMAKLGVTIPANGQVSEDEFLNILQRAKDAGMEPLVVGTGDRPFTGAYLSFEPMLRKLGPDDYLKLLQGKLSYADPRVVEVLEFTRKIVDMGVLPKSVATLSLTDSYAYFYNRKGLMFPQGTWYSQRGFAPAERGGQPDDLRIGVMGFPAMKGGACNKCRTLAIGGGYGINADTNHTDLAVAFLKELATPEMGTMWVVNNFSLSGVKADTSKITGKYAPYFKELAEIKEGAEYFVGIPLNFLSGQCKDTFVQIINVGLPAGLVSVADAVKQMNAACYTGG